jgi:hypothetical protein
MPADLKDRLDREAKIAGRSLNTEIVMRLSSSLETPSGQKHTLKSPVAAYAPELSDIERQMLSLFKRMSVEKQLALVSLFK